MESFFKSGEKKKRQNEFNECNCFEEYQQNKDDEKRFPIFLNFWAYNWYF